MMATKMTDNHKSKLTLVDAVAWAAVLLYSSLVMVMLSLYQEYLGAFRLLFSVAAVFVLALLLLMTQQGRCLYKFTQVAWEEIMLVVWPQQSEVVRLSILVVVSVATVSTLLFFLDSAISSIFGYWFLG